MSKLKEPKDLIEYKTFEFKIDEVDEVKDEGVIEGYASTFGNMDLGFDIVEKGAFKKTLKENKGKFPILADHSPYEQIGWNEQAAEDDIGLKVKGSLVLTVQKAKERYALAKKALELKTPMGLSIGYYTVKAEPDNENRNIRRIKEVKLFEYSLVTFPMNTAAMVTAAKSFNAVDKVQFLLQHLKNEGISLKDLEQALQKEAAAVDNDPMKYIQSIDRLIGIFKG